MKVIMDVNRKTRDELLSYLLEQFNTITFDEMDMQQVAEDNGLTYRELQCYFANKKRLFVGTYYHYANHLINYIDSVLGNDTREFMDMVRTMAKAMEAYAQLYPKETHFLNLHRKIDSAEIDHEVRIINERHKDSLRYIIKNQVDFSDLDKSVDKRKLIKELIEDMVYNTPEYMENKWSKIWKEIKNK